MSRHTVELMIVEEVYDLIRRLQYDFLFVIEATNVIELFFCKNILLPLEQKITAQMPLSVSWRVKHDEMCTTAHW